MKNTKNKRENTDNKASMESYQNVIESAQPKSINTKRQRADKFMTPFTEKFIYDLNAVPSMIKNCNFSADANLFRLKRKEITAKHQSWLLKYPKANHSCPVTQFPVTSGELAILHFQQLDRDVANGRLKDIQKKNGNIKQKKLKTTDLMDRYEPKKNNNNNATKKTKHQKVKRFSILSKIHKEENKEENKKSDKKDEKNTKNVEIFSEENDTSMDGTISTKNIETSLSST